MTDHPKAYRQGDQMYCPTCTRLWDRDDDPPGCVGSDLIHTTVGVYSDGSMQINGVCAADLKAHIDYNKLYRPGRALFVDGECVAVGDLGGLRCLEVLEEIKEIKRTTDTAPYR